ncbi:hypothetical protein B0H10DRAFT_1997413 [Mycena sp. CBHHK59/15]|nr:hypothetical protein B0H10DRAFT_1997413 [Mycena sp. CBHHK59/15]
MILRPLARLFALSALNITITSTHAAPLGRLEGIHVRTSQFEQYTRRDEISDLVGNITGNPVSNDGNLTQTLGSLFGANSTTPSSSESVATSSATLSQSESVATLSTTLSQSGSVVSQYTSTAMFSLPTGMGPGSGESDDAASILSEFDKILGASATLVPNIPIPSTPVGGTSSDPFSGSGGFGDPETDPGDVSGDPAPSPPQPEGHRGSGTHTNQKQCAESYAVVSGDTCAAICTVFNLTAVDFLRMNPSVGAACTNLQLGQRYCVQKGGSREADYGDDEDWDDKHDDEYEEDDDDDGDKQVTVVHIDAPADDMPCDCEDPESAPTSTSPYGSSSSNSVAGSWQGGLPSPAIPSAPISSIISSILPQLPIPTLFPPIGMNSTDDFNSTDPALPPDSDPSGNSSSTAAPSLAPSMGGLPFGNGTTDPFGNSTADAFGNSTTDPFSNSTADPFSNSTADPFAASQPAPSATLDLGDPALASASASSSPDMSISGSSVTVMDSRAAPSASPSLHPKTVKVTWEEDF